jgi:hypothetical protein
METRAMERYRGLIEDGAIFLLMAVFTAMKQLLSDEGEINWRKTFAKIFTNLIAGVGLYSFLLSYKPWYGEYPQKIGVIMFVVYAGSRVIDIFVDKVFKWFKGIDMKEFIRKLFNL